MVATEHKNSVKGDSFDIELPAINELRLFVQCLNEESACSVSYETAAWHWYNVLYGRAGQIPSKQL